MKKWKIFLIVIVAVALVVGGGFMIYRHQYNNAMMSDIATTTVDKNKFRPYILGTPISFARDGNSAEYIKTSDGWGGQEPEHRCALNMESVLNLYIPNGAGTDLRVTVDAFGVFNPNTTTYQQVTVLANGVQVAVWRVGYDGPFVANIPASVMSDDTLSLQFLATQPYTPPKDSRKIFMAVREITVERVLGAQTKRKIGIWIKQNLMDGGMPQTYDTDISTNDELM